MPVSARVRAVARPLLDIEQRTSFAASRECARFLWALSFYGNRFPELLRGAPPARLRRPVSGARVPADDGCPAGGLRNRFLRNVLSPA